MTDRLVDEGHISFEQAELAGGVDGTQSPVRLAEGLGYVGALGVFIATIALMVEVAFTDDFLFGGIDNIPGGLVTLVGAAVIGWVGWGFAVSARGAVRRSGGFLLGAAWVLWAITVYLLLLDLDIGDFTPIVVVVPIVAVTWFIWNRLRSVPTQLVLFLTVTQVVNALLVLVQVTEYTTPQQAIATTAITGAPPEQDWIPALVFVAVGLAWLWLTNEDILRPRNTGFAIGSLFAAFNGFSLFGTADGWVILSAAIALIVLYGGLTWRSSVLLAVGAVLVIALVGQIMSIVLDEVTAIQVALWFGIPGLAALAYSMWSQQDQDAPPPQEVPETPPAV